MPLKQNKQFVERLWSELLNQGRVDALPEFVSPAFLDHSPLPGLSSGFDGMRDRLVLLHGAFPDFRSVILDLTAEEDKVVALVQSSGTHKGGPFLGAPATGKPWSIQEIHILRLAQGKLVEHWGIPDFWSMLQQLGLTLDPRGAPEGAARRKTRCAVS
ncbi:MAG: ester cyclase [Planctomycetes bacterium]|nr:ester cyclase [Planctomycetota bacterium]